MVFIRNDVLVEIDEPLDDCNFNQYCSFKIVDKAKKRPLNFCLFYRSPRSPIENNVELEKLFASRKRNTFVIGDINMPNLHRPISANGESDVAPLRPFERQFANAADATLLANIVDFPTNSKAGNVLDVIYTDIPESVISCDDIGNLANSDHSIIKLVIDFCPNYNSTSEMIRDWKRGDVEGLAAHLSAVNFSQILQDKNANEAWEALKDTLDDAMNR